jgi:hypothetical protein
MAIWPEMSADGVMPAAVERSGFTIFDLRKLRHQ